MGDNGSVADAGCDQLAVIIRRTRNPGLGSLATDDDLVTRVRSVGRATVNVTQQNAIGLLLLERSNCLALDVNGNGPFVTVLGYGTAGGLIHSDSLGNGGNCSSQNKVLNGNTTIPGISAMQAQTGGAPGVISTAALSALGSRFRRMPPTPGRVPSSRRARPAAFRPVARRGEP